MTPLRRRMLDEMVLRGMAERTREAYVGAVVLLARWYGRSPDTLGTEDIKRYLLHLHLERGLAYASINQYACAYKFLYFEVLGRTVEEIQVPFAKRLQRLPELLTCEELSRLFAAARSPTAATLLRLAYASGLRLHELVCLRLGDIQGTADRMCLRVVQGKGGKDRLVPLSADALQMLRTWWAGLPVARRSGAMRSPQAWLFAGSEDPGRHLSDASPQRWYHAAAATAGVHKTGGFHTLRHCYATHMLERGVDLYTLQQWLGHRWVTTTARYLRLTRPDATLGDTRDVLALLSSLPSPTPAASATAGATPT